jgi:hypothetical protein
VLGEDVLTEIAHEGACAPPIWCGLFGDVESDGTGLNCTVVIRSWERERYGAIREAIQ